MSGTASQNHTVSRLLFAGLLLAGASLGGSACNRTKSPQPAGEDATQPPCVPSQAGFANPELAFSQYVTAMNKGDWCKVINTFARTARSDVALGAFKTLAVLASAQHENRPAYLQEFQNLARKHGLEYQDQHKFIALTVDLMNKRSSSPTLDDASRAVDKAPEGFYVEILQALKRADPKGKTTYDESLADLTMNGDTATGKTKQNGGRVVALHFVKTESGWLLKFE
jgi:hypothetical protein